MSTEELRRAPLRCRILGHKFRYDVIVDTEDETVIDVECRRSGCDYDKRLDDEWIEERGVDV